MVGNRVVRMDGGQISRLARTGTYEELLGDSDSKSNVRKMSPNASRNKAEFL